MFDSKRFPHAALPLAGDAPAGEVIVVGSGKGGVGKSMVASRLAAAFARGGRMTLLCDGTQHRGHLHLLLGVRTPPHLEPLLLGNGDPAMLLAPIEDRLWLLPSASGSEALASLDRTERAQVHFRLSSLFPRFDVTVLDADAGVEGVVRAVTMHPARLLLVATPEPASLADASALAKVALQHCPGLAVEVVVNRAESHAEGRAAFARLDEERRRFTDRELPHLATLLEDPAVGRAVRIPGALLALPERDLVPLIRALVRAPHPRCTDPTLTRDDRP